MARDPQAFTRRANEVAGRMRGCGDADRVFIELKHAVELAKDDGTIRQDTDEQLMERARLIAAGGSTVRWT